jgi:hypothetical protein
MPMEVRTPLFAIDHDANNIGTHLNGETEVPARATLAQGQAIFRISDDGQSVDYKLIASNIDNVFMAHIHSGPVTTPSGPIVVWLYPSTTPVPGPLGSGRHDGILSEGTFTAANLVGPLKGHPLSDLLVLMRTGNAYVNVHTNDGVDGLNTGPGDFPGGEIRGGLAAPGKN